MGNIARKSDGRRIFTDEFKRKQVDRLLRGELTVAELSRKLGIAPSLLQRWKRLAPQGAEVVGLAANGRVIPASELQAPQYIRELQLLVGKQAVELELLRTELHALMKRRASKR
jgi:transposase